MQRNVTEACTPLVYRATDHTGLDKALVLVMVMVLLRNTADGAVFPVVPEYSKTPDEALVAVIDIATDVRVTWRAVNVPPETDRSRGVASIVVEENVMAALDTT